MTMTTTDRNTTPQPAPAESTTLNGLTPSALAQAISALASDPSLAPIAFRARTAWQGSLRSRTDVESYDLGGREIVRRHAIHSDEPLELFGGNTAPNPQDLLLAAVNACMTVGFVVAATARGVTIEALAIESSLALDLRGAFGVDPAVPPGAPRIRYRIEVKGSGTRQDFEEIHREMIATSPNRWHLANPVAFDATLVVR